VCTYISINICVCVCVYIYIYIYICVCVCVCVLCVLQLVCLLRTQCTHLSTHTYTHKLNFPTENLVLKIADKHCLSLRATSVSKQKHCQINLDQHVIHCMSMVCNLRIMTGSKQWQLSNNIHTYLHTYLHTYTHTHTQIHKYINSYGHIHTHIHMSTYIHTYVHTHTPI
jgi:hypothetical protein